MKWLKGTKKIKTTKKTDGDDEVRVINVDKCFFFPPRNNLPFTLNGFFRSFYTC